MKVLIAVPCMDTVSASFAESLARLKKGDDCEVQLVQGSLVYDSRNRLAAYAMSENFDAVLWMDADMIFPPDLLEKLSADIETGKDIVSGLCFCRRYPYAPVIFTRMELVDNKPVTDSYTDYPEDEVFRVAGCGFGVVMTKTDVLRKISEKYHTVFSPLPHFGEDFSFCIRARECGYEIWCDSSIPIGHVGYIAVTDRIFKSVRKIRKKENEQQNEE